MQQVQRIVYMHTTVQRDIAVSVTVPDDATPAAIERRIVDQADENVRDAPVIRPRDRDRPDDAPRR